MVLPSPGTLIAGKYQLESLLGEGGMGAVFRARHVLMDAPVALKWLRPDHVGNDDARARLLREARSVARVRHPNVVQVYDVDTHEGALFMVMELLEGQSFADLIAGGNLSTRRTIQLLIGAMQGCAAAHEHGIIHRDIKPENIFVVRDRRHPQGLPKLLDFGISKMNTKAQISQQLTQSGLSVGTPLYMSIEQLTHTSDIDARTDVYSFGVVLYRALTGRLPYDGETFPAVVLSIALATPPPLRDLRPELPASLEWVVMKAMARKREDRYATIDALIAALRAAEALSERPPPPPVPVVAAPTPRPSAPKPPAPATPAGAAVDARSAESKRAEPPRPATPLDPLAPPAVPHPLDPPVAAAAPRPFDAPNPLDVDPSMLPAARHEAADELPEENPFKRLPWRKESYAVAAAVLLGVLGLALWGGFSGPPEDARAAPASAAPVGDTASLTQSAATSSAASAPSAGALGTTAPDVPPPLYAPPVPAAYAPPVTAAPFAEPAGVPRQAPVRAQKPEWAPAPVRRPEQAAPLGSGATPTKRAALPSITATSKSGGLRREDF